MPHLTLERSGVPTRSHSGFLNDDERRLLLKTTLFSKRVKQDEAEEIQRLFEREPTKLIPDITPLSYVQWSYILTIKNNRRDRDPLMLGRSHCHTPVVISPFLPNPSSERQSPKRKKNQKKRGARK